MKIVIQSNSINMVEMLKKESIDVDYGYSYTLTQVTNNETNEIFKTKNNKSSWLIKFVKRLDKWIDFKEDKDELEAAKAITKSVESLQSITDQSSLSGMMVQLNSSSKINQNLSEVGEILHEMNFDLGEKIVGATSTKQGEILYNKMIIGVNIFSPKNKGSATSEIAARLGIQAGTDFVVFHEAGHNFELLNKKRFGFEFDSDFGKYINNMVSVAKNSQSVKAMKDMVSKEFKEFDPNYMKQMCVVQSEIYADTTAFLLMRNKEIAQGTYDKQKSMQSLQAIIDARRLEHGGLKRNNYSDTFNHLTVTGLEVMKENFDALPNEVINQNQLHQVAKNNIEVGLARLLIASVTAQNSNVEKLQTIFNFKTDENNEVIFDSDKTRYQTIMTSARTVAGEKWLNEFDSKVKEIDKQKPHDSNRAVWLAAIDPDACEYFIQSSEFRRKKELALIQGSPNGNNSNMIKPNIQQDNNKSHSTAEETMAMPANFGKTEVINNMQRMRDLASIQRTTSLNNKSTA